MSLVNHLTHAARSLNAHSAGVQTAGKNIANANDPAYARQRVELVDRGSIATPLGPQSLGMDAAGTRAVRDAHLDARIVREDSREGSLRAQEQGWRLLQNLLGHEINRTSLAGEAGLAPGLSESLDSFFNAFEELAANSASASARQAVLAEAELLASRIRELNSQLDAVDREIAGRMAGEAESANDLLRRIAELNSDIERLEAGRPGSAGDLRDRRQKLLEELAGHVQIEVAPSPVGHGRIDIRVLDANDQPLPLIENGDLRRELSVDGTTVMAGDSEVFLHGGSLLGWQRVSREGVAGLRSDLAGLTSQLVTSVNEAYAPSGRAFFDPDGLEPGSIRIVETAGGLRASPEGGSSGGNETALAVAALAGRTFSLEDGDFISGTLGNTVARMVSGTGQALRAASSAFEDQQVVSRFLRNERSAVSGVSMDEEMADLLKFQRAFQASARVMNVVDGMLELVVTRLGR